MHGLFKKSSLSLFKSSVLFNWSVYGVAGCHNFGLVKRFNTIIHYKDKLPVFIVQPLCMCQSEISLKDLICFVSKPFLLDKSCTTGTQAIILKSKNRFERTKDISFKLHGSGCIILQHKLVKTIKLQHRSQLRQFSTKLLCWRAQ